MEPTIFTNVRPEMRIAQEEVFGPVLAIMPFDDDEEAMSLAVGHLAQLGHTRIGLAVGPDRFVPSRRKTRAFVQALRYLKNRISIFTALPIRSLDPLALGSKLREIGRLEGATTVRPDVA